MGEKIKRKIIWDEKGVSEILADMLILVITISLFTVIILFLYTLPAPDKKTYAEFDSNMEFDEDGGSINITHIGGETLRGDHTKIYLLRNTNQEVRILNTQGSDGDNIFYGIQGDRNWDPNEVWSYFFGGITASDDLVISIVDQKANSVIMKSDLLSFGINAHPIIMERWHDPNPAINGTQTKVSARVFDYNGRYDIESVYFNASQLNRNLQDVFMEDPDDDGIFEAGVLITQGKGDFTIVIKAKDKKGELEERMLQVTVIEPSKPVIEFIAIEPNSVKVKGSFVVRAVLMDLEDDLNFSDVSITPEPSFYAASGSIDTSFELIERIPLGGIFETGGLAPASEGIYNMTVRATDCADFESTKLVRLTVIQSDTFQNVSFNDSIWAFIGPESLDFKKFYYTVDDPPSGSSTYYLAVYIQKEHIGNDCFFHINVINHYYEDAYIDGNSKIRLLQIGGAASNKDLCIVRNGTNFGEPVGTSPDGTWYRIPTAEDGDYFHGGEPVSLVFGPFDLNSAKEGDVFGSILVLTGSFGQESISPENRLGQTLPFQAIVIA